RGHRHRRARGQADHAPRRRRHARRRGAGHRGRRGVLHRGAALTPPDVHPGGVDSARRRHEACCGSLATRSGRQVAGSVLLTLLAILLAGCTAGAELGDVDSAADGASTSGDGAPSELRLAIGGESEEGYDPTLGWGSYGNPLFQSTLLRRDADLELVGDLATDWSVSDDG